MDWTPLALGLIAVIIMTAALFVVFTRIRQTLAPLGVDVDRLRAEISHLTRSQEDLRLDVQRSREASLLGLAETAQGIRGDIGQARRALTEVKAIEEGRARLMDRAVESLGRLESVIAGAGSRGAAGENILVRALSQLPPDLLETNVAFGSRVVEYALRLPGGRLLPIDSKWTSAAALEQLEAAEDGREMKRLVEQVTREVRQRVKEMSKYLDPDRTLALAVLALPDAAYFAAPEAHGEGYREGVLVVPYSLAFPYLLALYRLALRFGTSVDVVRVEERLRSLEELLKRTDEELEGRLSRALVQLTNARDDMRTQVSLARRLMNGLLENVEIEASADRRQAQSRLGFDDPSASG
ncbi:MAG: DNA recombination protein RmuC [Vicinamibacteria bacterium]|nr:DNA recombination protein RmuC [Vicinamibacteria bacterium]